MCLLLLYSCFVLLHQNLVSHNYFATHNTFSTKTLLSTLFFITKNRFSKPMKKKAAETEKVTVSSNWTHTYTYQQYYHTTTDEEHTPLRDLLIGVYFFPYQFSNSLLISCFISILQKHRTTTNDPKEYPHKVKTRKTKLFGERIKTIYTLKVRLLHQNIPLYITMQFDCHFPFHRKTHYANQNKQTTTLQNLSTGNWKRHWTPLTNTNWSIIEQLFEHLWNICCKTILPFLKGNWLIDLFTKNTQEHKNIWMYKLILI